MAKAKRVDIGVGAFSASAKKPKRVAKPKDRFGGLGLPHGYMPLDQTTEAGAAEHQAIRELIKERTGRDPGESFDPSVELARSGLIGLHGGAGAYRAKHYASAVDLFDAAKEYLVAPTRDVGGPGVTRRVTGPSGLQKDISTLIDKVGGAGEAIVNAIEQASVPVPSISPSINLAKPEASTLGFKTRDVPLGIDIPNAGQIESSIGNLPFYPNFAPVVSMGVTPSGELASYSKEPGYKTLSQTSNTFIDFASAPAKLVPEGIAKDQSLPPDATPAINAGQQTAANGLPPWAVQAAMEQNNLSPFTASQNNFFEGKATANGWDMSGWNNLTPGEKVYRAYTTNDFWSEFKRGVARNVAETGAVVPGFYAIFKELGIALKDQDTARLNALWQQAISPFALYKDVLMRDGLPAAIREVAKSDPLLFLQLAVAVTKGSGIAAGAAARSGAVEAGVGAAARVIPGQAGERAAGWAARRPVATYAQRGQLVYGLGPVVETKTEVPITPPTRFESPLQIGRDVAEYKRRVAEAEAAGRVTSEGVPYEISYPEQRMPFLVGVTDRNLFGTISLSLKRLFAENTKRKFLPGETTTFSDRLFNAVIGASGDWYRHSLGKRAGSLWARQTANIAQGQEIGIRDAIERELRSAMGKRAPSWLEKERAAFELMWAKFNTGGEALTPAWVADQFDALAQHIRDTKLVRDPRDRIALADVKRMEDQAKMYRLIDETKLGPDQAAHDAVVAHMREVLRPYAERTNQIIAEALGITVEELRKQDYLRLFSRYKDKEAGIARWFDPTFEPAVKALYKARVGPRKALIRAQKRVAVLARRVEEKGSESGWGAKGAAKSRAAFKRTMSKLSLNLRRAERAALEVGLPELAMQYRALREQLVLGRRGSAERLAAFDRAVAELASVTDEMLAALPKAENVVSGLVEDMRNRFWNEIDNAFRERYSEKRPGWVSVEYVRARDLRGMSGNIVDEAKVQSLRGQEYENPIILDYDPDTGLGYISEGNHRLAAASDEQWVPVQVMRGKVKRDTRPNAKQITEPKILVDSHGYVPSYLYPHEVGLPIREMPIGIGKPTISEKLAALPEAVRPAAEAVIAARGAEASVAERVAAAEQAQAAALEAVAPGRRVVNQAHIALAERKLAAAKKELARVQKGGQLSGRGVQAAEARVAEAQGVVDRLRGVESASEQLSIVQADLVEAQKTTRQRVAEATRILKDNSPVLDTPYLRAALDASGEIGGIEILKKGAFEKFTMKRARAETIDEFVARMEQADTHALVHVMQRQDFEFVGEVGRYEGDLRINTSAKSKIRPGRFKPSEGYTFVQGREASAELWRNMMFDVAEAITADGWRNRMDQLIQLTSLRVVINQRDLEAARSIADGMVRNGDFPSIEAAMERAVEQQIGTKGIVFEVNNFRVISPKRPSAKKPADKVSLGVTPELDPDSVAGLMWQELNERTVNADVPGEYFLMPRGVYDGIQQSFADEAFRFRPSPSKLRTAASRYGIDKALKKWRAVTLNILPRTAFSNIAGGAVLALQAGASPLDLLYAYRALRGSIDSSGFRMAFPPELRQRWYDQLTTEVTIGGKRRRSVSNINAEPSHAEVAAAGIGWWMNAMRRLNSFGEDWSRLAVYYSQAIPAAKREAARVSGEEQRFWRMGGELNQLTHEFLSAMSEGKEGWEALHRQWLDKAFQFAGDLHRGGSIWSTIRIAIPFQQWYTHMLKLTFWTMPIHYPGRAMFLQMVGKLGQDYQDTHGIMVPWGDGFIPIAMEELHIDGVPQWVTKYVSASPWYPQSTVASLGTRTGESNIWQYLHGTLNPQLSAIFYEATAVAALAGSSPALDPSGRTVLRAAKDEYGNEVTSRDSEQIAWYMLARLQEQFPLSATLISMASRPSTASALHPVEKIQSGPSIRPSRTDLMSIFSDPYSAALFIAKAATGMTIAETPGLGPIYTQQLRDQLYLLKRDDDARARRIAKALLDALNRDQNIAK